MTRPLPRHRPLRHRAADAAGVTLAELLVTIFLGLVIMASALAAIDATRSGSTRATARQEAVSQAAFALARITRETRQATVVAVQGSRVLDIKTRVRSAPGAASELHRVRYDCSGGSCVRKDCGVTTAGGTLAGTDCDGSQEVVLAGVALGEFTPELDGAALSVPPARETPGLDFVGIRLQVRLDDFSSGREAVAGVDPVEITAGVEVANVHN